jgi:hypothetical protein
VASVFPRDRLQPSLFDRLDDELGSAIALLAENRRRLEASLTTEQQEALVTLLSDERLVTRPPGEAELRPFVELDADSRDLLDRVIELERAR